MRGVDTDQRLVVRVTESNEMITARAPSLSDESFNSFLSGFGERLLTEVKKLAPKDVKIKVSL